MTHVGVIRSFLVLIGTTLGLLAVMPSLGRAQNAAGAKSDDYFNYMELNAYGGWGNYTKLNATPSAHIADGAVVGGRLTENIWEYFALEQDLGAYSYQKLSFRGAPTPGGVPLGPFPLHIYQASGNLVLHMTPRGSKFRPFVTVGVGGASFDPNGSARRYAQGLPPSAGFGSFGSSPEFQGRRRPQNLCCRVILRPAWPAKR